MNHERLGCGLTDRRILDSKLAGTLRSQIKDLFYPAHLVLERSIFLLQLFNLLFVLVDHPKKFLLAGILLLSLIVFDLLLEVLEGFEKLIVSVTESGLNVLVLIHHSAYLGPQHLILLLHGLVTTSLRLYVLVFVL